MAEEKIQAAQSLEGYEPSDLPEHHPRAFEPLVLGANIIMSLTGAIIGLQLICYLGITTNTAIIGAMFAMIIARLPLYAFRSFLSVHRQNLVQTAISSATFGAANSLLLPIGVPWLMGRPDLVVPVLIGVAMAMFLDAVLLYFMFDSKVFPGEGIWPPGIATAEAIIAGDRGGKRARLLVAGLVGGVVGSYLKLPMSAFGVAFIGNIWALSMFGIGLLIRGYSKPLFGFDINTVYAPHGIMVGAGLVALVQIIVILIKRSGQNVTNFTRGDESVRKTLSRGFVIYIAIALVLAVITGLYTEMSGAMFAFWIIFAAFAAIVHELIVGLSAMHAGWFPAFATALIFLIFGMIIGFPALALAVLVGFCATTGPAFADMGYDLKTGWLLRGSGAYPALELDGRRQQLWSALTGFGVATLVVAFSFTMYFHNNLFPPVDRVYVATIKAGLGGQDIGKYMLMWAIPGAIVQLVGGPARQLGVLFATGLLIFFPMAGWAVMAAIAIRLIATRIYGAKAQAPMYILAAGFIAGDALYSFFDSVWKLKSK